MSRAGLHTLSAMPAPTAMLSTPAPSWPAGEDWVLEPKYDGYRLLIETTTTRPRAWSRHGTSLTEALGELLVVFADLPAGCVIDSELIALADVDGFPRQDFAAVGRAVFGRDRAARQHLHIVAFDLPAHPSVTNFAARPWRERADLLAQALPTHPRVRRVEALPAEPSIHERLVALGFEGSILKRPGSAYRPGRTRHWQKVKARHVEAVTLGSTHRDRKGRPYTRCQRLDGQRITASGAPADPGRVGELALLAYTRVDANGDLREARLLPTEPASSAATARVAG